MTPVTFPFTLGLATVPLDYDWNMVILNTIGAAHDSDSPRLADAFDRIGADAAYALGVTCAEWVVARVADHADTTDALLRIAAARAAQADPARAVLPLPPATPPTAEVAWAQPLRLAMKLLGYLLEAHREGNVLYVRRWAYGLARLADHVAGRAPAFPDWLATSFRRAQALFPPDDAAAPRPVPREFFDADVAWQDDAGPRLAAALLQQLDPAANPYLVAP